MKYGRERVGLMKHMGMLSVVLTAAVTLLLGGASPDCRAEEHEASFKDAEIFIEFNSTDEDAGIQVSLDGDDWKKVTIVSPEGGRIFDVRGKGSLKALGLTELFFESVEPELTDLPLAEFLSMFPEGDYVFEGKTNDGTKLRSESEFTHVIPCGPEVSPDEVSGIDPESDIVIEWEEVTGVIDPETEECDDPADVEIDTYLVIVASEDSELVVELPEESRSLRVPSEIIGENTAYKYEVLAREESGNQTITESYFCTGPDLTAGECEALADAP